MYETRLDLSAAIRGKVIPLLQGRLADAVDLFTQVKHAHWNVKGAHFIALHELFDQIAEIVEDQGDLIAERITALGGRADGTARVAASGSSLAEYPLDATSGARHLQAVAAGLAAFGAAIRQDIEAAAALADAGTADVFTEISREMDKQLWFVEAHLQT